MNHLVAHEDEHLLVVRKPAGINTHASGPFAGEGIYDWLRHREPRWTSLALVQRLDKETSGILLLSKTRRANASLTRQFTHRRVHKEYVLWSDRRPPGAEFVAHSWIRKARGRFESCPVPGAGLEAETRFTLLGETEGRWRIRAEPLTGRTHQIRLHAADGGFPVLGDLLYGGTAFPRLCLHARALRLRHPATNEPVEFINEPEFEESPSAALRRAVIDETLTNAFRIVHGAADGRPGWYVDRLGDYLLASRSEEDLLASDPGVPTPEPPAEPWLLELATLWGCRGVYRRRLDRHVRHSAARRSMTPQFLCGEPCEGPFPVREEGLLYEVSLSEGYSMGLFLDQRDNRRRLRVNWIGGEFPVLETGMAGARVLNVFAYTCAFSVAAAAAGAITTSLDLSRKVLDSGRRNFEANGLDPASHDFVYGDAFDWMRRFVRRQRHFDVVLLDPPTFSQSRQHGLFRAEADYAELVGTAAALLRPGGTLFASTNAARLAPENFLEAVRQGLRNGGLRIARQQFFPQPPDFPTSRDEPGYLKTVWVRVEHEPQGTG